ncbi:MAG: PspC domain-containing protein [bacterium]
MKRLTKIINGQMIFGVCNGLSRYFNIDVSLIRLLFLFGTIFTIFPFIIIYIIMAIVLPYN